MIRLFGIVDMLAGAFLASVAVLAPMAELQAPCSTETFRAMLFIAGAFGVIPGAMLTFMKRS